MQDIPIEIPRILVAALRGGSGKTIISIGIIAALCKQGKTVAPFKKGPDYIDAGWLALAASRPCFNLDTFMVDEPTVCRSFFSHSINIGSDIAVIEGNRGLYDGLDVEGTTSTAALAKLLNIPVVLCVDCTKTTRTMAAVVLGCLHFDPAVMIKGVILNQVAGHRHENLLRRSIEKYCGIPVIGAIPKLKNQYFPERHMGLIPTPEHGWTLDSIRTVSKVVEDHVDISAVLAIAHGAPPWQAGYMIRDNKIPIPANNSEEYSTTTLSRNKPKIGIIRDSAFQFYYPDNLDALTSAGAELVFISPLTDASLPEIDALYIGGGFPETHAEKLSENISFKNDIKTAAEKGLPIYAECGGLMYLGDSLVLDQPYKMAGVLPIVFGFSKKPQGHGYTVATVDRENPYFKIGTTIKGHEFHYSTVMQWNGTDSDMAFSMSKGGGIYHQRDGICYKSVFATYTHIHALGIPQWATTLVQMAASYHLTK